MLRLSILASPAQAAPVRAPLTILLLLALTVGLVPPPRHLATPTPAPAGADKAANTAEPSVADTTLLDPPALTDPRALPAEVARLPELVEQRTANSATFREPDGRLTSIVAAGPLHFRDEQGRWQIIDPAFRATADGFVVDRNSIRTRAGRRVASLAAVAGGVAFSWRATTLGAATARTFTPLAAALDDRAGIANRREDGRVLHYPDAWSDPHLAEQIVSAPGSVEHLLVLNAPPTPPPFEGGSRRGGGTPTFLELRATLRLWPGTTLWADDRQRSAAFHTAGALELRDAEGRVVVVFDPVRAFEQEAPEKAVAGEYTAQPGAEPGTWTVGARTPWSWWQDPARHYPAVIDPTMRVLRTTGDGTAGMAWVDPPATEVVDSPNPGFYQLGQIVLGSVQGISEQYRGYLQFNALPAALTNNTPSKIISASLTVTPYYWAFPWYEDADIDWDEKNVSVPARLADVPGCDPAAPTCFSLRDNRLSNPSFSWSNRPVETAVYPKQNLTVGPLNSGGKGKPTTWDVTTVVANWYNQQPQPGHGPAFAIWRLDKLCEYSVTYMQSHPIVPKKVGIMYVDQSEQVKRCMRFGIDPGGAQLKITYEPIDLGPTGINLLNAPGVPSYFDGVFEETNHLYDLQTTSGAWYGVAVRGDHDPVYTATVPVATELKVRHQGESIADGPAGAGVTSFVLLDGRTPSLPGAPLQAEVIRNPANDFPNDQARNYRIHHARGGLWTPPGGTVGQPDGFWRTETVTVESDQLITLREFYLGPKYSGGIVVTASMNLDLVLVEPTAGDIKKAVRAPGAQGGDGILDDFMDDGAGARALEIGGQNTGGHYALAIINRARPFLIDRNGDGTPDGPGAYQVKISILACPDGTIPTKRLGCQPLIIPHGSSVLGFTTHSRAVLGLTIHSEGNFQEPGPGGATWCTTNEQLGAPMIGPFNGRYVYVAQGRVCYNATTKTLWTTDESGVGLVYVNPATFPDGTQRGQRAPSVPLYGSSIVYPAPADKTGRLECQVSSGTCPALSPTATTLRRLAPFKEWGSAFTADPNDHISTAGATQGKAIGSGTLTVPVAVDVKDPLLTRSWQVPWALYPDQFAPDPSTPASDFRRYSFDVDVAQPQALPLAMNLATLELRLLDGPDGNATGLVLTDDNVIKSSGPTNGQFSAPYAKLTQPAGLGGATKRVQVIVQPPGKPRRTAMDDPDPVTKNCGDDTTSCLDLRRLDYLWDNGNGEIKLVDLADIVVQEQAGLVAFSRPGQLLVFSKDHPGAMALTDIDQSFGFESWGARVKITEEVCDDPNQVVTVIRGTGAIALPMMGHDGSNGGPPAPPAVTMRFKLCETKLKEAQLSLDIAPEYIPIGSTGLGGDFVSETVTIGPDHTTITFELGFRSVPSEAVLSDGLGQVTIDTRGLFAFQGSGELVGKFDAKLQLNVAWNPLDVLTKAEVSGYGGFITGALKMHAWVGQGWQGKYSWLPPNSDFHFTGSIAATLHIAKGSIAEIGPLDVPPGSISISAKVAFGEFCTNSACTKYAWGVSAKISVAGYNVGVYADTHGIDFIFGSDSHVLIDEAANGSALAVQAAAPDAAGPMITAPSDLQQIETPGAWQPFQSITPKSPVSSWPVSGNQGCSKTSTAPYSHTCSFPVHADKAGRAVFSVGWQNGDLEVALIKPDNTVITDNAPGVVVTKTVGLSKQVTFSVSPSGGAALAAGTWKIRLTGSLLAPGSATKHNYRILFATDPPPPTLTWINPVTQVDGSAQIDLQWQALRGTAAITERLELFYTPLAFKPVTDTEVISATMIANGIAASQQANGNGHYLWETSGLASGEYAVGARIDDHAKGNGHLVFWAPGSVVVNDTTPPPAPLVLAEKHLQDALTVIWQRDNTTRDLAGYLIEYTYPSWDNQHLTQIKRVLPHRLSKSWFSGLVEQARLGGLLLNYTTTYCVRAYDASGNVSSCDPHTVTLHRPDEPLGPPEWVEAEMSARPLGLNVLWGPPTTGNPAGSLLSYEPIGCQISATSAVANEGLPAIDVGNVTEFMLTGLQEGQRYLIGVAAYESSGLVGPETTAEAMYADPADNNGDGLPDAWAAIFGVSGSGADPDGDGLTNGYEFSVGSYPTRADSDHDGYDDGVEATAGTDLCGPEHPDQPPAPKLVLVSTSTLSFKGFANVPTSAPQQLIVLDFGGGPLNWTASASQSWIVLSSTSGDDSTPLEITVNPAGLGPGLYQGQVTITNVSPGLQRASATAAQREQAAVPVEFHVLPDRYFNVADLQRLGTAWQTADASWDLTGDGFVNILDVQMGAARWRP